MRLCLPATVDNFDLASLLNPLLENHQHRVCLEVSRVSRLGTVEFRVLGSFADQFKRRGGFLKLENVNAQLAVLVREFGFTDLVSAAILGQTDLPARPDRKAMVHASSQAELPKNQ